MTTVVPFVAPTPAITYLPIPELLAGDTPPVEWLVEDFLPRGSLIALAGEPGTGKSFFTYSLTLALTTGTPFLGFPTTPKKVLYFDQENSYADCVQYMRWAWHGAGCPDRDLMAENLSFVAFQLGGSSWPLIMETAIREARPDLIVIDTATPCFNVTDENDNGEATQIINNLRRLMSQTTPTATCIVLKHAKLRPEDSKYTLRGAKAWEGAVDSILFQTKKAGRPRLDGLSTTVLTPGKVRAFGLRSPLTVNPGWIDDHATGEMKVGLRLSRVPDRPREAEN